MENSPTALIPPGSTNPAPSGEDRPTPAPGFGRLVVQRRITADGHSFTLAIPRAWVHALRLERGSVMLLELQRNREAFTVTPFLEISEATRTRWRVEGADVAMRKLMKIGNSLKVSIPRDYLHALKCFSGDRLLVRIDEAQRVIAVRPLTPRAIGPDAPRAPQGVGRIGG